MASIPELHQKLNGDESVRILITVYTKSLNSENYLASASDTISKIAPGWENNPRIRFLLVDVYERHTFIVADINNHGYNFETAHKDTTPIPVYAIRQVRKTEKWVMTKEQKYDMYIAHRIAELHDWYGLRKPPFLEDHHFVIEHTDLREPQKEK
ncbi:uncharacterized protein ATNIH1004_002334 [Aspergillus tanneri]|uniref:Uncharacterized protein n=1 Tax=Aspergillus tanneri TaxID=1220188 RepID=A0A5M9MXM9_9EURO|nr:uncharacterized protein ATNIH1004_002334 [Aspergillus tanneri]KAA8649663.1 hypothetical protein ATNIH1004_002334 [Aspergillus tanneri]